MKDYIKEFEEINERVEKLLEAGFWNRLKNVVTGKSFGDSAEGKKKQANRKSGVTRKYTSSTAAQNYLQSIESGEECKPGVSNGRFSSEPGSNSATFYKAKGDKGTGIVKDIKPFLDNAGISKKTLRCYNLEKDPLRIAWLFDGTFNADVLGWDKKKKKVIFQGDWKDGLFGGINYPRATDKMADSPLEKQYKIVKKGQEIGPFSANDILKLIAKGKETIDTIIRAVDSTDYQYVKDDKILSYLLKSLTKKTTTQTPVTPTVGFGAKQQPNLGAQLPGSIKQ